jgi:HD superfamily phosphohydrolase
MLNKKKIINDPLYGFVHIPHEILYDLIEHPYFQRLRRIKQLGLSDLVYPGALHTRFNHAIGAMHLMLKAIESLRSKEVEITEEEEIGACIGILLHDIGHGPFSHTLEHSIVRNIAHEKISLAFMEKLNKEFNGKLSIAIQIFKGQYKKRFLCQLISGQLDTDRLDYLNRDSFFTGVAEGVVGADRIIHMMDVRDNNLVVHQKGVYSLEKFIVARRLMYWQVYLHKTVVAADVLLTNLLKRAKELCDEGKEVLSGNGPFKYFLESNLEGTELLENDEILEVFSHMDDVDVVSAIKEWTQSEDKVLRTLSKNLLDRKLPKIKLLDKEITEGEKSEIYNSSSEKFGVDKVNAHYFSGFNSLENSAYLTEGIKINILQKNGDIMDLVEATDNSALSQFTKPVKKYYACYY